MKKVAFILATLIAMMLAGCGEGSSSAGAASETPAVVEPTVDATEAELTTPKTPYNLSVELGTPPGLPD